MAEERSVGLIGAGAVGSLLASAMLANGQHFSWVVRNPDRRDQLDNGLVLRVSIRRSTEAGPASEDSAYRPPEELEPDVKDVAFSLEDVALLESIGELPRVDWLILAVKADDVQPILRAIGHPEERTLVVANGLHDGPHYLGILNGGAYIADDGAVVTSTDNDLILGELGFEDMEDGVFELMTAFHCPWIHPIPDSFIHEHMWIKLAMNCVVNPLTALLDCSNGQLFAHFESPVVHGILTEVHRVINAEVELREPLTRTDLLEYLDELLRGTASNSSSMREDLRHGRRTEIRCLNLAVAELGERLGLPCPITSAVGNAILALEGTNWQIKEIGLPQDDWDPREEEESLSG